ncbi:uncharacterized protein VP01_215g2 [Puccinia sorghi]|uniref:Ethanolaminephosphotransferase n=1 Tax=Puccinia sorghi TaxID=27349 RepID=A0A0L6VBE1_9BASI|nr:uncharacterized protein VP01_215g2 [Puccinia sorghi]
MDFSECKRSEDYLDDQHLSRLKNYQYRSVDHSPTTKYILRHCTSKRWNTLSPKDRVGVCSRMDASMVGVSDKNKTPNTITLIGLMFIVVNVMTVVIYVPDLKTDAPSWIYFSFDISAFHMSLIYDSFLCADSRSAYFSIKLWIVNVDGKQARKTGTSSPLGELFDHGIDSLNCVLGGLVQCAAVGSGHSLYAVFILLVACWPMYLSTWEEYHTVSDTTSFGVLYLGFINGYAEIKGLPSPWPTEGLLIAMAVLVSTGFEGVQLWSKPVENYISLPEPILNYFDRAGHELKLLDLFVSFVMLALVFGHAPSCFYNTYMAIRDNKSQPRSKQDSRISSFPQALLRLSPLFIFTFCSASWLASPHSHLLKNEKIIEFGLMLCFIFGRIATRIILSHLTKSHFPFWSGMLTPLIGGSLAVNLPVIGLSVIISFQMPTLLSPWGELVYLRLMFFFCFVGYVGSSLRTINRFCEVLRINCLTIRSRSSA